MSLLPSRYKPPIQIIPLHKITLFLFQRYNDPPAPSLEELKSRQKKAVPTLEELKNKPKANVPWTKKTNAQPVKKEILAEEKEVKEFES